MLITDKQALKKYTAEHRIWQGIPSIEVTEKGRIFASFYSGETGEKIGNFALLVMSNDGDNFTDPIAVAYKEGSRCFDPCIWIDPLGRLWFTWSVMPWEGLYGVICEDPDAEELAWGEVFFIGHEVMMNKPTVLSTGEWLFPITVWGKDIMARTTATLDIVFPPSYYCSDEEPGAFVYKSLNRGKSFQKLGRASLVKQQFDEHMILELKDGRLAMFVRTWDGVGVAYSYDRGETWIEDKNGGLKGPGSRFHVRRLKSGRILLINHVDFQGRNNLTALLSDDECKTWKYRLLLDGRDEVSYPDAKEADDGYIYITYDRERGASKQSMNDVYSFAREILYAKVTEEDIMAGHLVNEGSRLKCLISKLGKYAGEGDNLFEEADRYSDMELATLLLTKYSDDIVGKVFEYYPANTSNMRTAEYEKLDQIIKKLEEASGGKMKIVLELVSLVRSISVGSTRNIPVIEGVKDIIINNLELDLSVKEIAKKMGISVYYMQHQFKKMTKVTITDYKNALKLAHAKEMLVHSQKSITDIAQDCGFCSSSYFSEMFLQHEHISPSEYRKLLSIGVK